MPRMSKKRRLEWAFFLNERNRITCLLYTSDAADDLRLV